MISNKFNFQPPIKLESVFSWKISKSQGELIWDGTKGYLICLIEVIKHNWRPNQHLSTWESEWWSHSIFLEATSRNFFAMTRECYNIIIQLLLLTLTLGFIFDLHSSKEKTNFKHISKKTCVQLQDLLRWSSWKNLIRLFIWIKFTSLNQVQKGKLNS